MDGSEPDVASNRSSGAVDENRDSSFLRSSSLLSIAKTMMAKLQLQLHSTTFEFLSSSNGHLAPPLSRAPTSRRRLRPLSSSSTTFSALAAHSERIHVKSLQPDVVSGLVHLHRLGLIHRDLKPQRVLITKELCDKLYDMSSRKLLPGAMSSSGYQITDFSSSGLQAPEQLCCVHQTCSVDVFGLDCILFFCVTGGRHPFDSLKGNSNIEENTVDLPWVEFMPEDTDLFAHLVNPDFNLRPRALEHVYSENEGRLSNWRSDDEGDPNLKALSKRKKQCKSGEKNPSLDNKDEPGSLENNDRICNIRSCDEADHNLKMPSKMKKAQKLIECDCDCSLNKKDELFSSNIEGKFGSNRIHDEARSKMKVPCLIKKTHESGKRNENLDIEDEKHVSSEDERRLDNRRSGDEGDHSLKRLSKRMERCKSGKSNGSLGKEEHFFSEDERRLGNSGDYEGAWMNLKKHVSGTPGRWIGKLFVSNKEIAKGSNGTIVLEGFYEGRSVAVKRVVQAHRYIASQEIQCLTASDLDPNIVRLYGAENDQNFVYLALERCSCSLDDLIRAHSNSSKKSFFPDDAASNAVIQSKLRLDSVKGSMQDVNLWREDGHPSPLLLKLIRDVVSGLVHLHRLGIIHRDLKPKSVLITKELCAKLSDMGNSELLHRDTSSAGYHLPVCGSSGLQVPENPSPVHQACSADVFGLGGLLFFCITAGRQPSGDSLKADSNIEENTMDLSPVEFLPEAADLFARLLNPDPNMRPKALEVLHHPLLWNSKKRLSFLQDISNWVELKAKRINPDLLEKLESIAWRVFDDEWNDKIDRKVIKHMRRFRAYDFKRVRDLLRIVRNMFSHYRGLPPKIQGIVGSSPEDVDSYFTRRFPRLLIEAHKFMSMCCEEGGRSLFPEYFDQ